MRFLSLFLVMLLFLPLAPHAWAEPPEKKADKSAAERLLAEGDKLFGAHEYAKATEVYKKAVAEAEAAQETSTLVQALSMAARGYLIRKQADEGRPWIERAAKLASPDDPAGWSRFLGVRGRFEWKAGEKPKATKTFEAMYAYCIEHELWRRAVDAAHMVAIVGSHEQQLVWAQKGIAAAEKGQMDGWLGPLWNNLGNTYDELKRPKDALDAWLKAREYHWKVGSEKRKLVADWAVGLGFRKVGDLQKAKQWQRPVLAWAERRLAERDEPERREWVALAKMELGIIALAEERREEASVLLLGAYPPLHHVDMASWHPVAWGELVEACKKADPKGLTGVHMDLMSAAIDRYRMQWKKLPSTLEELTETSGSSPVPFLKTIPHDAWGNTYELQVLDRRSYRVRSYGPDATPDTEDDIVR